MNAVSLALMAGVTWYLGRSAVIDPFTAVLAVVAFVLSYRFKINAAWLVPGEVRRTPLLLLTWVNRDKK